MLRYGIIKTKVVFILRIKNPQAIHRIYDKVNYSRNPLVIEKGLVISKNELRVLKSFIKEDYIFASSRELNFKKVFTIKFGHVTELNLPLSILSRSIHALNVFDKLEKLEIRLNQPFFLFHEELTQLPQMRFVEIIDDDLISLSFTDFVFPNLKSLFIHGITSDRIKIQLSNLKILEELAIQNTILFIPPKSLFELLKLKKLVLNNNILFVIPEQIGLLQDLEYLDLSNNIIKWIPESLLRLPHLKYLDLRENDIDKEDVINEQIILSLKQRGCDVFL